jgi:uncharacterized protein YraI
MANRRQSGNPWLGPATRRGRTDLRQILSMALLLTVAFVAFCPSAKAQSADEPSISVVNGLSLGDFLNIRATPSPIGSVQARLPNGSGVRNFGCAQYSGYEWCKVTTLAAPQMSGWAPERYLRTASQAEGEALKEMAAPSSPGTGTTPTWAGLMAKSETTPADPPENLDARIGGNSEAAGATEHPDKEKLREAIIARYGPLYRAALGRPAGGEAGDAAPNTARSATDDAAAAADPAPDNGTDAGGIPHPTPRPTVPGEAPASVGAAEKSTGEIPCAGAFGQPTQPCPAAVTRLGPGIADVVVSLPDGASRTIRFRGGKPDGSDSSEPLQATREGSLNMIRIGKAERFEILDAVALGK